MNNTSYFDMRNWGGGGEFLEANYLHWFVPNEVLSNFLLNRYLIKVN